MKLFQVSTVGEPKTVLERLVQTLIDVFGSLKNVVDNDHVVTAALDTTDVRVFHGLGQMPNTVEVVGLTAGEVVFESPTLNPERSKFVFMRATGPVTAKLRFT